MTRRLPAAFLSPLSISSAKPIRAFHRAQPRALAYGDDVMAELARASIGASFAPLELKTALLAEVDTWLTTASPLECATRPQGAG